MPKTAKKVKRNKLMPYWKAGVGGASAGITATYGPSVLGGLMMGGPKAMGGDTEGVGRAIKGAGRMIGAGAIGGAAAGIGARYLHGKYRKWRERNEAETGKPTSRFEVDPKQAAISAARWGVFGAATGGLQYAQRNALRRNIRTANDPKASALQRTKAVLGNVGRTYASTAGAALLANADRIPHMIRRAPTSFRIAKNVFKTYAGRHEAIIDEVNDLIGPIQKLAKVKKIRTWGPYRKAADKFIRHPYTGMAIVGAGAGLGGYIGTHLARKIADPVIDPDTGEPRHVGR
jgi:hypothetical protein